MTEIISPFKIFNSWLWDGNINNPIPRPQTGENGTVDILKYNSPITPTYVISLFLKHGPLNNYLNDHFNNMGVRYLDKKELFLFVKKCVIDFNIRKSDTVFYQYKKEGKLYSKLREKLPNLKNNDIILLAELIEKSSDKDSIYNSLDLDKPKKQKLRLTKKDEKEKEKISLSDLLEGYFSIIKQ